MTSLVLFSLLSLLTGNPLLALGLLVLAWWLGDRATFRTLPDPFRWTARWRRQAELRRLLADNPSDRRARLELADLLLEGRRPAAAAEALRFNVEAGDDDVHTAFLWGAAQGRSGHPEVAERAFAVARAAEPGFRAGEIDLELGRQRLARGDAAGAREALTRLLALRPGTVEGRWHLVRALDRLGEGAEAARRRQEGWAEYLALPRFQRRAQRRFAWLLRPSRPAAWALGILALLALALWRC